MSDVNPDPQHRVLSNTRRFDSYAASSAYGLVGIAQGAWPLIMVLLTRVDVALWRGLLTIGVGFALTAAELWMLRRSLAAVRSGGTGHPRTVLLRWSAVVAPLLLLTLLAPGWERHQFQGPGVFVLSLAAAWGAVSLAYPVRVAVIGGLIVAVLGGAQASVAGGLLSGLGLPSALVGIPIFGFYLALWVAVVVLGLWSAGWMLRVVMEVGRAGRLAAELAIAEDRLRISRDLHDVFGRTLATVAVKSELAETLARRGRIEQSADEMAAVRDLAEQTAREVRGVIRGYREADLDRELAGARALLDSAGIRCEVSGEPPQLAPEQAAAFGWVLREAITNVFRHSHATAVTISFAEPGTMIIENNGVDDHQQPVAGGHGLINMAQRMAAVGGRFDHRCRAGGFQVTAALGAPQ